MKILILGGTGAIGKSLIPILVNKGEQVWCTSRTYHVNSDGVIYLQGDAHDFFFLQNCLEKEYDVVIDFMIYRTEEFKNRIQFILDHTKHYIFTSSCRVFAGEDSIITEHSPKLLDVCKNKKYLRTDEYALAKAREEKILQEQVYKRNWTIIRPYITYNDNRMQLGNFEKENWLYRAERDRTIVFPENFLNKKTTMTSAKEVALYISELCGNRKALGEDYNLVSENSMFWKEILEIYKFNFEKIYGKELKIKLMKKLGICGTIQWRDIYDRNYDRVFDNTKIRTLLEKKGEEIFSEEIEKCMEVFHSNLEYKKIKWSLEGSFDRLTGDKTKLSDIPGKRNKFIYWIFKNISMFWVNQILAVVKYGIDISILMNKNGGELSEYRFKDL